MWPIFRSITEMEYAERDLENYIKLGQEFEIERRRLDEMIADNNDRIVYLRIRIEEMKNEKA